MISTSNQAVDKKKFDTNFDNIFGKKPVKRGSYVQGTDGKLVPKEEHVPASVNGPMVMSPLKPFVSPIDGTTINSRAQLDAHNKRHGVTNSADYKNGYIEKRAAARNAAGERHLKETRISDINSAINKHS